MSKTIQRLLDSGPATWFAPSFEKSEILSKVGAAPPSVTRAGALPKEYHDA